MDKVIKPVFFTSRALKDLEKIYKFNLKLYDIEISKMIINSIINHVEILENEKHDFKKIGSVDEEFLHFKRNYRKLIYENHKITYREGNDKIFINRIFDTRQNPRKNK